MQFIEIVRRDHEIINGNKTIKDLQCKVSRSESQIVTLKAKIDRIRHRATYWRSKCSEERQYTNENVDEVLRSKEQDEMKLQIKVAELEEENLDLFEKVEEVMAEASDQIVTFEKGKFTNDVRACCYELLSLNVGVNNVKPVINAVLSNIAHKHVDRLPGRTLLCDMMIECLTIAQAQLGEELSKERENHFTLQTDGTTKYGAHFGTYDISTTDTTYSLGLRHVFSGSAQSTWTHWLKY